MFHGTTSLSLSVVEHAALPSDVLRACVKIQSARWSRGGQIMLRGIRAQWLDRPRLVNRYKNVTVPLSPGIFWIKLKYWTWRQSIRFYIAFKRRREVSVFELTFRSWQAAKGVGCRGGGWNLSLSPKLKLLEHR